MHNLYRKIVPATTLKPLIGNHAEAAHRQLQTELYIEHPHLWKLFDGLRQVQKGRDMEHEKMVAGHSPPSKRQKYQEAGKTISKLVWKFIEIDTNNFLQSMLQFFRGLVHNSEMES